jgi:hypothetical protein
VKQTSISRVQWATRQEVHVGDPVDRDEARVDNRYFECFDPGRGEKKSDVRRE